MFIDRLQPMKTLAPKRGKLLISEPSIIGDVSFSRSVVLLTEYNNEGIVGFIINKPLDYTLNELVPEIDEEFELDELAPEYLIEVPPGDWVLDPDRGIVSRTGISDRECFIANKVSGFEF